MSTYSKTILIGNLGADPTMVFFEGGGCLARFSIATTEHWKDKDSGQKMEATEWHRIIVRNKQAEICEKYLRKGSKVLIEGLNKTRKYTDGNNVDRYVTEVIANRVQFMSPKPQDQDTGSAVDQHQKVQRPNEVAGDQFLDSSKEKKVEMPDDNEPDDLPF